MHVVGVASSDSSCNFLVTKWGQSLGLVDVTTSEDSIIKHFCDDVIFNRQLLLLDVALKLLNGNPVIEVFIDGIAQVSNAIHWYL